MRSRIGPATRLLALPLVLAGVQPACCDGEGDYAYYFDLQNTTPYFVHVLVPDANRLWVPPEADLTLGTDSTSLRVIIAPGQDAEGSWSTEMACCEASCGSVRLDWLAPSGGLRATYSAATCGGSGSCPYVYAGTASGFTRVGEALTGALNRGARREDHVPLEPLEAVAGRYQVRLAAELRERDHFDSLALELVDHAPGVEVVVDTTGALWAVRDAVAPRAVVDAGGRDRLAALLADDAQAWEGLDDTWRLDGRMRDWVELEFPRPEGEGPLDVALLVRGSNTGFVQEAYHAYMRQFGPGLPKLMRGTSGFPAYGPVVTGLLRSAGFALEAELDQPAAWTDLGSFPAVGPAGPRTVALRFVLPAAEDPVCRVRLAALPGAWRLERVQLAVVVGDEVEARAVPPIGSVLDAPDGPTQDLDAARLAERDGRVQLLPYRHGLTVLFEAPALAPGSVRTAFLSVAGWYEELDASPLPCIQWRRLLAAWWGTDSFANFVVDRLRKRRALHLLAGLGGLEP